MKRIVISLILLCALVAQAQHIEQGSRWYNGAVIYEASSMNNGNVVMNAIDEGEELEFMLVPVKGKADTYRVTTGPHKRYMVYEEGMTMKQIQQEGLDVLCLCNTAGDIVRLLIKTDEEDNQNLNVQHWMEMLRGTYTLQDGTRVTIDWTKANVGGYYMPIEPVTFNGYTTGLIHFDGDETALSGDMEVGYTVDGLILHPVGFDDYGGWHRLPVDSIILTETDPSQGRFDFARNLPLTGSELYDYDLTMLRLMRNSILAHHGYVFQSQDLQEYFGKEPWYKPADNNEDIQVSLLEQLNIQVIKSREEALKKELEAEQ